MTIPDPRAPAGAFSYGQPLPHQVANNLCTYVQRAIDGAASNTLANSFSLTATDITLDSSSGSTLIKKACLVPRTVVVGATSNYSAGAGVPPAFIYWPTISTDVTCGLGTAAPDGYECTVFLGFASGTGLHKVTVESYYELFANGISRTYSITFRYSTALTAWVKIAESKTSEINAVTVSGSDTYVITDVSPRCILYNSSVAVLAYTGTRAGAEYTVLNQTGSSIIVNGTTHAAFATHKYVSDGSVLRKITA